MPKDDAMICPRNKCPGLKFDQLSLEYSFQLARAHLDEERLRAGRDDEGGARGLGEGAEQVGPHARHVAHVVAHVVGDRRGVARVVLRLRSNK